MKLTLFVDESGDFVTGKGEWVVAGLLCRADLNDADRTLTAVFNKLANAGTLPFLQDCHLNEIRKQHGVNHANAIRVRLFSELFSSCQTLKPTLVVAINEAKRRVDQPERTYRTMLLDLVGLVEAGLAEADSIESFDVVIATRKTTKGGPLMTTLEQLDQQTRDNLPGQIEVGLASRGLWRSFETNSLRLKLQPAAKSWGIAVADFAANTMFNRSRKEAAILIQEQTERGQLSVFESFGSYEERRARVAERDGDRVAAIGRWASIPGDSSRLEDARNQALTRLWRDLIRLTGTTGPFASVESVLEWLMRRRLPTLALLKAVTSVENALARLAEIEPNNSYERLLYRIRNFQLRNINHVGHCVEADRVIALQLSALNSLRAWPEMLPHVLDFSAISIETAINKLDFPTASARASEHMHQVNEYLALWELFTSKSDPNQIPRWYVRAGSAFIRARTLDSKLGIGEEDPEITRIFAELDNMPLHPTDQMRLWCYRILSLSRMGKIQQALKQAEQMLASELDDFGLTWVSHAVSDALLAGIEVPFGTVVLERLRQRVQNQSTEHPADLIWREQAILEEFIAHDRRVSRDCFDRSLDALRAQDLQAPIGSWLRGMVLIHRDILSGSLEPFESYFTGGFAPECMRLVGSDNLGSGLDLLRLARRTSPY